MANKCDKFQKAVADLEEKLAELRAEMEGATGSVQHSLAGQIALMLNQLAHAREVLAACEGVSAPPPPPLDTHWVDRMPALLPPAPVSGTYQTPVHGSDSVSVNNVLETIRLDVDGTFPQMMASGSYTRMRVLQQQPTYWVAHPLKQTGSGTWEGPILKVWGDASVIPYNKVRIHVPPMALSISGPPLTVTFSGIQGTATRVLRFISPYFRAVTFEFAAVQDIPSVTAINTCAHAERPSSLRCEGLSFGTVYDRAGVDVTQSPRRSIVPLAGGAAAWSDAELDGAMHKFWSSYSDDPNWAVWTLFAGHHERQGLLGEMFDFSDQNQRQGCAIFVQSLDDSIPVSYPQRNAHVARMRFFDLVHETGHCFNLHHAWLDYNAVVEWPFFNNLANVATFMNYPQNLFDFFSEFEYRFHDSELKFLRHAPDNFVEMGDAPFYGGDKFFARESATALRPWRLDISVNRPRGVFEFLEPVTLTAVLTNTSVSPQVIDEFVLEDGANLAVLIGRMEGRARFWRPFAQRCFLPSPRVLEPGQYLTASFFIGAGLGGWYFAEPGAYVVQAALNTGSGAVTTNPLAVRVSHPRSWEEEVAAQEIFTRDVGRALEFGATPARSSVVETLRGIVERLPDRAVSRYAALALARGSMKEQRVLRTGAAKERGFDVIPADHAEARRLFQRAVFDDPRAAADTLGDAAARELTARYGGYVGKSGTADGRETGRRRKKGK